MTKLTRALCSFVMEKLSGHGDPGTPSVTSVWDLIWEGSLFTHLLELACSIYRSPWFLSIWILRFPPPVNFLYTPAGAALPAAREALLQTWSEDSQGIEQKMTYWHTRHVRVPSAGSVLKNQAMSSVALTFWEPKPSSVSLRMTGGGWLELVPATVSRLTGADDLVLDTLCHAGHRGS